VSTRRGSRRVILVPPCRYRCEVTRSTRRAPPTIASTALTYARHITERRSLSALLRSLPSSRQPWCNARPFALCCSATRQPQTPHHLVIRLKIHKPVVLQAIDSRQLLDLAKRSINTDGCEAFLWGRLNGAMTFVPDWKLRPMS
jgi:hypothetical protein